jgi:hypothetical protein
VYWSSTGVQKKRKDVVAVCMYKGYKNTGLVTGVQAYRSSTGVQV